MNTGYLTLLINKKVLRVILVLVCSTCVLADYYYDYYGPYSWEDDREYGDDDGESGSGSGAGSKSNEAGSKSNGNCGSWRWVLHNGNCYRFQNDYFKNWEQAQAECRKDDAELLSITDQKEFEYAAAQAKALDWVAPRQPVWIGLVHVNGQYEWTDGSPVKFTNWKKGEPNDYGSCVKTYTAMYKQDGGWADVNCKFRESYVDTPAGYICKKPEPIAQITTIQAGTSTNTIPRPTRGPVGSSMKNCKTSDLGKSYAGNESKTKSKKLCMPWAAAAGQDNFWLPTSNQIFPEGSGEVGLKSAKNFCRNPDSSEYGPWCFIDLFGTRELCNIELCPADDDQTGGLDDIENSVKPLIAP
ncbi:unnamed protein product [Owenia fusiformis]|uniref:Uncharacterized protein n=1 Tax=Owenia fusiformis TaxID=6347 RepID=A0A8S4N1M9_OWEFU|nr:unnamed protein product [Owenia fusiformis]